MQERGCTMKQFGENQTFLTRSTGPAGLRPCPQDYVPAGLLPFLTLNVGVVACRS